MCTYFYRHNTAGGKSGAALRGFTLQWRWWFVLQRHRVQKIKEMVLRTPIYSSWRWTYWHLAATLQVSAVLHKYSHFIWVIPGQINTKKPWPLPISLKLGEGIGSMWKVNNPKFQLCRPNSFWDTAIYVVLAGTDFRPACYYLSVHNFRCGWLQMTYLYQLVALSMLFHLIYILLCINYFKVKGHYMQPLNLVLSKTDT